MTYFDMFASFEMHARLGHSLTQHIVDKQSIEPLFTPFLELDVFQRMTLEEIRCMTHTYLGPVKPELLLGLEIGKLNK
jgi:hypothetical protein